MSTAKACPTPRPFNTVAGTIFFLTILYFLNFLSRFVFPPLFPTISQDIAVQTGIIGTLFLLAAAGSLVGSFIAGFISSRFSHRGAILAALFGAAVFLVIAGFAPSIWVIGVSLTLLGFFFGLHTPSSVATVTAMVRPTDWGKALSVQQLSPPLSLLIAPLLVVLLLKWFSWQVTLFWTAGICVVFALVFIVAFRGVGYFPGDPPSPSMLGPVLRTRSFWVMIFLFSLGMGAQAGIYSMLPLYLTSERGMSADSANTLLGLANISPLVMAFVSGWVVDKIGEKKTIVLFLLPAGVFTALVGTLSGTPLKVCVFLMAAFAVGFFPPAMKALSHIVQPTYRSLAAGFGPPVAFLIGGGLLPTALGFMGQSSNFGLGITIAGIVIAVGSLSAVLLQLITELEEGC